MKIIPSRERGSVLMTTMVITAVLGITLASFLSLVNYQSRSATRAQTWNSAMPLAEAGIEEALSQIKKNGPGGSGTGSSANLAADNWTLGAGGYVKQRALSSDSYYVVTISTNVPPTVTSQGYVLMPTSSNYISRTVQVTTTNFPLFAAALASRFNIKMNGNGYASDSFNSSDPALSTNAQYDPAKTSTNGDVASVFGPVDLGNHTINGDLYLGPTATYSGTSNQVTGKIHTDFNMDFPDVVLPATTWFPPAAANQNQTIGGTTYDYAFLNGGDYVISSSGSVYVGPNATVRLKITASSFSPKDLRVAGTAGNTGSLSIYMTGASTTLSGNTTVESGVAANFSYYGLPGNTSLKLGGNSVFIAVIYAPEADLTLSGTGPGLIGASTTKTITMNGKYAFHYDEALRKAGPSGGYVMASWDEL